MKKVFFIFLAFIMFSNFPDLSLSAKTNESDEVFKNLAGKLSKVESKIPNKTIAIYGFEVIGKQGDAYAKYATEKLTHEIVSEGYLTVIERSRIDQVLKEQSLSLTGAVDSGTAAKIGKILSVDAVIIGTIHITHGRTEFIARVIQSEKGVILASADEKIESPSDETIPDNADDEGDTETGDDTYSQGNFITGNKVIFISGVKPLYTRYEQVTVKYAGLPGNQQDWITLVSASEPDTTYGEWFYTRGERAGSYTFKPVGAGDYEVRIYFNWPDGGYIVQKRIKIKVK